MKRTLITFTLSLWYIHIVHSLNPHHTRGILQSSQQRESNCSLSQSQVDEFRRGRGRWIVDNSTLRELQYDIQLLIDCTDEGDTILFDVETPIQPPRRLIIPWSLTLTAITDPVPRNSRIIPETQRKVVFQCPQENEGLFLVNTTEARFGNFVFSECSLNADQNEALVGIITVRDCSERPNSDWIVALHHVQFRNNFLNGTLALYVDEPSCSVLQIMDMNFWDNTCFGTCAGYLSTHRNELEDVRIRRNRQLVGFLFAPIYLLLPDGSNSTIQRLSAERNTGTIIHTRGGFVRISGSSFSRNIGGSTELGVYSGGVVSLSSSAEIVDCEFRDNVGTSGASIFAEDSSLSIQTSSFVGDSGTTLGAGISLLRCASVNITNSVFSDCVCDFDGGGVYSNGTENLQIRDCIFTNNSADYGSGVSVISGNLEIFRSQFQNNRARVDGAGFFFSDGVLNFTVSVSVNNTVTAFGGAGYSQDSSYTISNSTFFQNSANYGGALGIFRASGTVNNTYMERNSARQSGGGLYLESVLSSVVSSSFVENSAEEGGGLYEEGSLRSSLISSTFLRNNASFSGAGAYLYQGSHTIESTLFEENLSTFYGGGFSCFTSFLNASRLFLLRNRAETNGGGTYLTGESEFTFLNCSWVGNSVSGRGAGAYFLNGPVGIIQSSSYTLNRGEFGAGIFADGAEISLQNSNCTSNLADTSGGAFYMSNGTGIISNCSLRQNTGVYGGALFLRLTTGQVWNSTVMNNRAQNDGGGIYEMLNSVVEIENSSVSFNSANSSGGGIFAEESSLTSRNSSFDWNVAGSSGGSIFVLSTSFLTLTDCAFGNNLAGEYGGGFYTGSGSSLTASHLSIESCSARRGGGISLYRASGTLNSTSVLFSNTSDSGGGLNLIESQLTVQSVNISKNTVFGDNENNGFGGGLALDDSSVLLLSNGTFFENRGAYGAGIYSVASSQGNFSNCSFFNNSASASGGSSYAENSTVEFQDCVFNQSSGFFGGALYAYDARLTVRNSQILNSFSTDVGGAMFAVRGSFIVLEDSVFVGNEGEDGGTIMVMESYLWGRNLEIKEGRSRLHGGGFSLNESSSLLCSDCLFEGNQAVYEGGGIRLASTLPQLLAFQLIDCIFRSNEAAFGGGIHFQTGDGSVNCSDVNSTYCTFLALTGSQFVDNQAHSAGGAILSNNPSAIRASCQSIRPTNSLEFFNKDEFGDLDEFSSLEGVCRRWSRNRAGIYGPEIGSYARRVTKTVFFEQNSTEIEIPENRYVIRHHPSGVPLPSLFLEVVDEYGQGPALIQGNEIIQAVMTSPDGLFAGTFTVQMESSRGNFSGVTGFIEPGNYDVRVDFSEESLPTMVMVVEIRPCLIGEAKAANGTFCQPCNGDTYNFLPEDNQSSCQPCPEDAHCDSVVIRPKTGYWHQTPCSHHIQDCLSEVGCDEADRDSRLYELGSSVESCEFEEEFIQQYSNALCREGYTGALCGSCEDSYGKSRSFRCEKCFGRFANFILVLCACLVLFGLTGFTIRSSLPSPQHAPQNRPQTTEIAPQRSAINLQMVKMYVTGIVPKEVTQPSLTEQHNQHSENRARSPELAKWKAVEIFKITVNYLQVTGIAIAVNVDWTDALILVFEATEFLGGVTSEAATRSTDCLISTDSSVPRSAVRQIISLIVPSIVGACFAVFWAGAMIKHQAGLSYLVKRCVLSAMAVTYLSYITITKTAVNILYCVEVYDSWDFLDDSMSKYWAVDTALKCYEGPHAVLAGVFGYPTLVLFSLGFPLLVASVLILERSRRSLQSSWLFETAGFMYRSYSQTYIFWESVILLRKALLAVVVVFAYPLGGNLQGILAVCVLMIALYFQIVCCPYRVEFEKLNELEGLSLLISSLTFVSGLFFNDDRTSTNVRAMISVFLIFANVGIFIYFLFMFFKFGTDYLKTVMDAEQVSYDENAGSLTIFRTFMVMRIKEHFGQFWEKAFASKDNSHRSSPTV